MEECCKDGFLNEAVLVMTLKVCKRCLGVEVRSGLNLSICFFSCPNAIEAFNIFGVLVVTGCLEESSVH